MNQIERNLKEALGGPAVEKAKAALSQYDRSLALTRTGLLEEAHAAIDAMREHSWPKQHAERMFVVATEDRRPGSQWYETYGTIIHEQYLSNPQSTLMNVCDRIKKAHDLGLNAQGFLLVPVDVVKYMETS